jgi:hypothetical protein
MQCVIVEYENLSHEIAKILAVNDGVARNFTNEEYRTYRKMAERCILLHERMRTLERLLQNQ